MSALLAAVAQRAWAGRGPGDRLLRAALLPAAAAYGAATTVRNRLYDAGWLTVARVPAHVLSVGNLTVGGTGKTPTTLWLAQALAARGRRVGIVARGYRKRRKGVVVVGVDGTPLVDADEGGDEAVMLARRFAGPVVTGERRAEAALLACARFALDTIVLDDGFQHRGLARDADLVLLGPEPLDAAHLLPAGPLREAPAALARARAVLLIEGAASPSGNCAIFRGRLRASALVRASGAAWVEEPLATLVGRRVTAVAGIVRPERLTASLTRAGATVGTALAFPDHHAYGPGDVARIAAALAAGPVVTTEKDLVKLAGLPGLDDLRALRMTLDVDDGEALVDLLTRRVDLRPD